MSSKTAFGKRWLSVCVVWTMAASFLMGVATVLVPPAAAANCTGPPSTGDWTVTGTQVCLDTTIVMDGSLIVPAGTSLTIRNGGLKFVEDTGHVYGITVSGGGRLTLDNSKLWTETNLINPYLQLTVSVTGSGSTLNVTDSTLAFPGTISVTTAGVLRVQDSVITRTEQDVNSIFSAQSTRDDNDDAAGLTVDSSNAWFLHSSYENLYENTTAGFLGSTRQHIRLQGTAILTAIDTYLAIDNCCTAATSVQTHNTLDLVGTSRAYLYGVTVDASETASKARDEWVSSVVTAAGTQAHVYRWGAVRVVDANGVPVANANVDANFMGGTGLTGCANYPDNANLCTPPAEVLAYLGKSAANWDLTGPDGAVRFPLRSDLIDSATQPDSRFIGAFDITGTSGGNTGYSAVTFDAYPDLDNSSASKDVTVRLMSLVQQLPDLTPMQPTFDPSPVLQGDAVNITAPIANAGLGGAANIVVRIYDGVTLLDEVVVPFIAGGGQQNVATTLTNTTGGQHVIRVSADPDNTVYEGPSGSAAETNNLKGYQLLVTPLGPDLAADMSFSPDPGFLNNPVQLIAGITNVGHRNATNVRVNFYVQSAEPTSGDTPTGFATVPFVDVTATAALNWTPTSLSNFTVWAWVDPYNSISEPAPYSETNNKGSNILRVTPSPDLVTFPQDLATTDPFPRKAPQSVSIDAVVRNNGQASAGAFRADFFVDGTFVGSTNQAGTLAPGSKWTTGYGPVSFADCGAHTVGINVDAGSSVPEGWFYEQNNMVTVPVQVYPDQIVTWQSVSITDDHAISSNLEIGSGGAVVIDGAKITILQDQSPCGRYYVKVLTGGSLTIRNSEFLSNWPLVIYVAAGGTLTLDHATLRLDNQGKGALYSKGILVVRDSVIYGDVTARGTSADLRRVEFRGASLAIDTSQKSRLWDSTFPGVTAVQLLSDAPTPKTTPDFDIRNVTFNAQLTAQLVFAGNQWVQLTSVSLSKTGDWWSGMAAQNAHVSLYWWLTVLTVDGTNNVFADSTTIVRLKRFNPSSAIWENVPACAADECYYNSNTTWPVGVPTGELLYRAPTEDRYGSLAPLVRASYQASGYANIDGPRYPDEDVAALVMANTTIKLVFSELTPDLVPTILTFSGDNGIDEINQPINRPMTIALTVQNLGQIATRSVYVYFYSTDVDGNGDGYMDNTHTFYVSTGSWIGAQGPFDISPGGTFTFAQPWTPPGAFEGSRFVSAVVDPALGTDPREGGAVGEIDETNNIMTDQITLFTWPDLDVTKEPLDLPSFDPIVGNAYVITVAIWNDGTNAATNAQAYAASTSDVPLGANATVTVPKSESVDAVVIWIPSTTGTITIRIRVDTVGQLPPPDIRNTDYDISDNYIEVTLNVRSQPELSIVADPIVTPVGESPGVDPFRGQAFDLRVHIRNSGQTEAPNVVVAARDTSESGELLGAAYGVYLPPGDTNVTFRAKGIRTIGARVVWVAVDANSTVAEPDETDNVRLLTINVKAPEGSVVLEKPAAGSSFQPSHTVYVQGRAITTGGDPIEGENVTIRLFNSAGQEAMTPIPKTTTSDGIFFAYVSLTGISDGSYTIRADALSSSLEDDSARAQITILTPCTWYACVYILPLWIWLIVIIGVVSAVAGGTAYVKFVGLGKLVECGECGAYIAQDSVKCPKCGVEFEKDMAKCSNCQSWIPVEVKQCPECGVEFATGEVEMADYEAQMRRQYEDVKKKFREEAQRELGRTLTEREFEDWWRTQPTFVTFEDWLREEEEMRRMGSKPCPTCSTLNSVTATVCHKCGTLLKEMPRRREPPSGPRPAARQPAAAAPAAAEAPAEGAPEGEAGRPTEAVPKKVVKKPIMGAPVVQKKVIRRPLEGEGGEEGGGEEQPPQ